MCSASSSLASPRRRAPAAGAPRRVGAARRVERRHAPQQLAGELAQPGAGGARGGDHRHLVARAARATARPPRARARSSTRSAFESASTRGSRARRASCAASSRSIVAWLATASAPSPARQLGREVEHVHEQPRALDVGEEVVAEPGALAGALDQAGDVGEHELALVAFEHAEHRRERRERVVGDLRRGARQPREQRGLAGVGQPDEPDVGEQLQPQLEPALLARQAALGEARRLARGRGEALVALAARAAARDRRALARRRAAPSGARRDRPPSSSRPTICVPGGTRIVSVSPSAPWRCAPSPCPPRPAR